MPSHLHIPRSRPFFAAALACGAAFAGTTAARAQVVAWAWVNPIGAGSTFTPSPSYQHAPGGGVVTVTRDPAQLNRFFVDMPNVGAATGVVHVSPYGGSHLAVVNSWGGLGTGIRATVELFTSGGAAANSAPFTIHYRRDGDNERREAYLWADQPALASYTPSTTYSWNGNRADPTISRTGAGVYTVTLPGLAAISAELGHVQVTPYSATALRAKVGNWAHSGGNVNVTVRTFDAAGAPADGRFVLSYNESAAPIAAGEGSGAHVWANSATSASYTPSASYTDSNGRLGPADAERITRLGTGVYEVELPNVAPSSSSIAQVTAYGSTANHASIGLWSGNGCGGSLVRVHTYTAAGSSTDAQFDLLFLTNRPADARDVAWAWVFPAGAGATFTPSTSYQHTPGGALITVDRDPAQQNRFFVKFPGLAPASGAVHACAYAGNHIAVVNGWGEAGADVTATVELFSPNGAPANDGAFSIHFRREGPNSAREAYVWANQPTAASYTPSPFYSWNGDRADPTITRSSTGVYAVTLPDLATGSSGELGHVQVTAYGNSLLHAKVASWQHGASAVTVNVRCFDAAGAPADGLFVLSYNESAAPIGPDLGSGAHVWASNPTAASYSPTGSYTDSNGTFGPPDAETITRTGTGSYRVSLPNVAPSSSSIALATAYGSSSHYASIGGWFADGAGGTEVNVRTYDAAGALSDTMFTLLYLTDRSAIEDPGARHRYFGVGCEGVGLTASPDPLSTATAGTTVSYRVHNAPAFLGGSSPAVGVLVLTLNGSSGISLAPLGAPGCTAYVGSLDATLAFTGAAGSPHVVTFAIPPGVPCGTQLFVQAAALTNLNAFGIATSNGIESRIDDF